MNNLLETAKRIVKENYSVANCGIFDSRNLIGDTMTTIYEGDGLTIDICYNYAYFEVFGLSNVEFKELETYYNSLGERREIDTKSLSKISEDLCKTVAKFIDEDPITNESEKETTASALNKAYLDGYCDALRVQASGSGSLSPSVDKYFQDRLSKLPFSSYQTLKDVREILDILDKHSDEGEVQNGNSNS